MSPREQVRPLLDERSLAGDAAEGFTARRYLPADEPFFAGHFPRLPVTPGVFLLEALAECARRGLGAGATLASVPLVRFRRQVRPGDTVDLSARPAGGSGGCPRFEAVASVDGQTAVQATFEFRVAGEAPPGS